MMPDGKRLEQAERASQVAEIAQHVVQNVESDIISGVRPDVRELRMMMGDVRHLTSLAFKRIFQMMLGILGINVLTLIVVISLLL